MEITKSIWVALVSVTVCFSQTYNISGIVTDTGTTPIAGALVRLEQAGLTATSGQDGRFTLSGTAGIARTGELAFNRPAVTLQDGLISIELPEPAVVRVQVYSVQGRLISMVERSLGAGSQSMSVPQVGTGVCIYRVKIGEKETFDVKRVTLDGKQGTLRQSSAQDRGTERQAKTAAAINDVIAATKTGYLNYRCVQFTSDTARVAIKMIVCADTLKDIDGNVYQTVRIGNQVWMAENLRVTRYNDGSAITHVTDSAAWRRIYDSSLTTPAYCFYKNTTNADSIKKYGALYNWYVVNPANPNKIAPAGWHVPSGAEWDALQSYLIAKGYNWDGTTEYNKTAKALAAKTDWVRNREIGVIGCNLTLNNRSGFSALPGGYRSLVGSFSDQSYYGDWWSATEETGSYAWNCGLDFNGDDFLRYYNDESCGFSVRLVKD